MGGAEKKSYFFVYYDFTQKPTKLDQNKCGSMRRESANELQQYNHRFVMFNVNVQPSFVIKISRKKHLDKQTDEFLSKIY